MELRLDGKRALITGASGGLGLHFADVLARSGAKVTLAARRLDRVEDAAARLREAGQSARAAALDVTNRESVEEVFRTAHPFDVVVNNAGIAGAGSALGHVWKVWVGCGRGPLRRLLSKLARGSTAARAVR